MLLCSLKNLKYLYEKITSMHKISFFFLTIIFAIRLGYSQAPSQLTTDLLEYTDRVFLDGYLTTMSLSELATAIERYQAPYIRNPNPFLGWVVNSETPNTLQVAYMIEAASTRQKLDNNQADMWNSGRIESANSISVRYAGEALQPSTVYYWRVKVWDNHGNESPFSSIRAFMTAPELDNGTAVYPLQITDEYPVRINHINDHRAFIDFGKAAFGRLRLTLASESGRDTVTVHLGEHTENGLVHRNPGGTIRYAKYKLPLLQGVHTYTIKFIPDDRNTARQRNESGVDPIFMPDYIGEVYPFRYCEIENYSRTLSVQSVVRQSVHSPFNDMAADFHSSDTVLNQIWELCKYSIKATSFMGVYVDGDRERIPYEADALINQLCHYFVDREFSVARHSHEHLIFNPTWPTEWILQSVLMAWYDYLYTGNKHSLQRHYQDLKAKTLMALKEDNGLISTRQESGKRTPEFYRSIHFRGGDRMRDIVDWPQSGYVGDEKEKAGEADGFVRTAFNTVVNAYHYEAVRLMSLIAETLGNEADQRFYAAEAERVKNQFNRLLFDRRKGFYKDGIDTEHCALHSNMFPMAFEMVSDRNISSVSDFIKSRGMACSVYGSQFLMDAIYNAQDAEYGLQLLTSTKLRSWYNMIRVGSTITLEAWDDRYKPNLDWNHAWGAAPANIIPRKLMGIEPIEPGFGKIRIMPQPASLRQAAIKIPTIRGDIKASFVNIPQESFSMEVEIPGNTTAEVYLPRLGRNYKLEVNGIEQRGTVSGDFVKVNIGSGKHSFTLIKN